METFVLDTPSTLNELLKRVDPTSKTYLINGNVPLLASRPSDQLSMSWENLDLSAIKKFCQTSQVNNRLIIGFLSYDLGLYMHGITPSKKTGLPLVQLYTFENWVEQEEGKVRVKYSSRNFLEKIKHIADNPPRNTKHIAVQKPFKSSWDIKQYKKAFDKTKEYISSGDIYQINLSYPMKSNTKAFPIDIYLGVQEINQASMGGLFMTDYFDLISLSPETFITIENRQIETFPIKGTRAKSEAVEDSQLIEDLINDKKEQAELNMISDLLRNDLSMVCKPGSVKIKSKRSTKSLSRVLHTYSHISGELEDGWSAIEALLKLFPGGSISGCPKRRALEIIDELEQYARGPYTGSLFTLDPRDKLQSNILIRTLVKKHDVLSLSVGGGIVFDSKLENEYQETLDKSVSITQAFRYH